MEVLYDPKRWEEEDRTLVLVEAHAAFMAWMLDWQKRLKDVNQWDAQKERWGELKLLGIEMLNYYVTWTAEGKYDEEWEPVYTEIEFEIPIPVDKHMFNRLLQKRLVGFIPPEGYAEFEDNPPYPFAALPIEGLYDELYLHIWHPQAYQYIPVYYQGRIDLIFRNKVTGKLWIVDHKTAAQFGSTLWFELDTQTRSYAWACKKVLGLDIHGVMFNRMRKKAPEKPDWLEKSGRLSKNMQQKTTPELYRAEIKRRGLNPADYEDFLSRFEGQEYVQRLDCLVAPDTLQMTEHVIVMEAIDMLDDPFIYPNPGMFNCSNCKFFPACQAKHDGLDDMWVLEHSGGFNKRS